MKKVYTTKVYTTFALLLMLCLTVKLSAATLFTADQILTRWAGLGFPVNSTLVNATLGNATITNLNTTPPSTFNTGQAGTNTTKATLIPVSATAISRIVTNTSATYGIYLGATNSTTNSSTGYYLAPSATVTIPGNFSITGVANSGAGNTTMISWIELTP